MPKCIKMSFFEDVWTFKVLSEKEYNKRLGDNSDATTENSKKLITFRAGKSLTKEVVAHELWHLYWNYLNIDSTTSLPIGDLEEIIASFMEKIYDRYHRRVKLVYKQLRSRK